MSGGRNIDAAIRLCLVLVVCTASLAQAVTRTWTGTGNWSTDGNWSGSLAPTSADDVIFGGASANASTVDAGFGGTVASIVISNSYAGTITQNRDLIVTNNFSMYGATWRFTAGPPASLTVSNNMLLTNCIVYCQYASIAGNGTGRVFTVGGDMMIGADASIDAVAFGFAAAQGPGKPIGNGNGGGHGGEGGYWSHPQAGGPGGPCYGSVKYPTSLGSGGKNATGGGAVRLDVGGTLTIDGTIDVEGGPTAADRGTGAGGSIWLSADTVVGNGIVEAEGSLSSHATTPFAPGGGGRIAVHYTSGFSLPVTNLSVSSKDGHFYGQDGASGTIYLKKASDALGTLIVDNDNVATASGGGFAKPRTTITNSLTDVPEGNFLIKNLGDLQVRPGVTLTIRGYWTNNATFTANSGSTVLFEGTNTSRIVGSTSFYDLVCTNADKQLLFGDGNTFTVNNILIFEGTNGNLLQLDSTGAGQWNLVLPVKAHSVMFVDVQDSNANGGAPVGSLDSNNGGNNDNWIFAALDQTNVWIGATSTAWSTDSNWSLTRPPITADHVIISNGISFYPILDGEKVLNSFTMLSGSALFLSGNDITFQTNVVIAGALIAAGTETIRIWADFDATGGTMTNAQTTVRIAGTSAQSLTCGGFTFEDIVVENAGDAVTFTDAVRATNLTNIGSAIVFQGNVSVSDTLTTSSGNVLFIGSVDVGTLTHNSGDLIFSGPVTATTFVSDTGDLTFSNNVTTVNFTSTAGGNTIMVGDGTSFAVTNLSLFGSYGNQLALRSTVYSNYWNLAVKAWHSVGHVDVQDSDASGGMTIYPIQTTNSGHNSNWDFSATDNWVSWDGSAGSDFSAADNWSPTGTPDQTSWLLIDGDQANAPVISGVSTVANLVVGGGASATLTANAALTVTGDVSVLESGTLTHSPNVASPVNTMALTIGGDLFIDGQINVDGKGYAAKNGPGKATLNQGGGGHGGGGGDWGGRTQWVGTCYGSITEPITMGSGGVNGAGGGAIRLRVTGATTVNGTISSSGADLSGTAAGAGGSIWLTTGTLGGSGTICADGGRGGYYQTWGYSHGGGGRVAVYLNGSDDFGAVDIRAISKRGANANHRGGGAGSVYLKGVSDTYGTCIYDNRDLINVFWSVINTAVTDTVVGNFVLRGSTTRLRIEAGASLTVNGDWTNAATFVSATNGTINFGGTGTNTVFGDSNFGSLSSLAANKTLLFEAGKTFGVSGYLYLDGPTLRSTVDNSEWYLTLSGGSSSQLVENVRVRDSNASGGDTIYALPPSANLGGNTNWVFLLAEGTVITIR